MIMRLSFFIPGGFISFLIALFIRLWAIDHGHFFLAKFALIYMIILLIPVAIFLLALIIAAIILLFIFIMARRTRFTARF